MIHINKASGSRQQATGVRRQVDDPPVGGEEIPP
jgi:hypothetical protein